MSIDMVTAIDADMAIINENGQPVYVDNDVNDKEVVGEFKEVKEKDPEENSSTDIEGALFNS